jgi:hypothetical protein
MVDKSVTGELSCNRGRLNPTLGQIDRRESGSGTWDTVNWFPGTRDTGINANPLSDAPLSGQLMTSAAHGARRARSRRWRSSIPESGDMGLNRSWLRDQARRALASIGLIRPQQ